MDQYNVKRQRELAIGILSQKDWTISYQDSEDLFARYTNGNQSWLLWVIDGKLTILDNRYNSTVIIQDIKNIDLSTIKDLTKLI